ncbi:hypothetical protein B0H14DRAFT_2572479 [Mycena olivaceomarginata]|nr:hypothetical protein B0H14DRAFT_2572479 [Mycena olivaceomarginata]
MVSWWGGTWRQSGAVVGGKGAADCWLWGGTWRQKGAAKGVMCEGTGRQFKLEGGSLAAVGASVLLVTGLGIKLASNQGGVNYHRRQLSRTLAGLLAQHLFNIAPKM